MPKTLADIIATAGLSLKAMSAPTLLKATAVDAAFGALTAATYYFKVVAEDSAGTVTGASNELSAVVSGAPDDSVKLEWTPVPGAVRYRIYKGTAAGAQDRYQVAYENGRADDAPVYVYATDTGATVAAIPAAGEPYSYRMISGVLAGPILDAGGALCNAKAYGAKGDTLRLTDGAITSGLTAFTSTSAKFTAADVGKIIYVAGAGAAGAVLATTISAYVSATAVTLTNAAGTTVSGAVALYGTDDTQPIRRARAAAGQGGTVYFPSGGYLLTDQVRVASGTSFMGAGMGKSILYRGGSHSSGYLFVTVTSAPYQSSECCTFSDLTIDGGYPCNKTVAAFSELRFISPNCIVQRCEFRNSNYIHVGIDAAGCKVLDSVFTGPSSATEGASFGVHADNTTVSNLTVQGCTFKNYRLNGIFARGDGTVVQGCQFEGNHWQTSPNGGGQLAFNTSANAKNCAITGNTFRAGGGALCSGIEVDGVGISITGNVIEAQQFYGIVLQSGSKHVVSGNVIRNGGQSGTANSAGIHVKVTNAITDFVITGNIIEDDQGVPTQDYGILVSAAAHNRYIITGNYCRGNTTADILDSGTGTTKTVALNQPDSANTFGILGGGSILNAKQYGAKGDGTTDDTVAIQAALSALPATGGTVYLPRGSYKITSTLTIGNGTVAAMSTGHHVKLIGDGAGHSDTQIAGVSASTNLLWYGGASPMLQINGPISGVRVAGIQFQAKPSTTAATMAIDVNHVMNSVFEDLLADGWSDAAFDLDAYPDITAPATVKDGCSNNVWTNVSARDGQNSSIGLRLGRATATTTGDKLSVNQQTFVGCTFRPKNTGNSSTIGIEQRWCDSISFLQCITDGHIGVKVSPPTSDTTFPKSVVYWNCAIQGNTASGTNAWTGQHRTLFWPYQMGDSETMPTDNWAAGVTSTGRAFGTEVSAVVAADVAVTNATPTYDSITGLAFSMLANEVWGFDIHLRVGSSSTTGNKFRLTIPAGATISAMAQGPGATNLQTYVNDVIAAGSTGTTSTFIAQIAIGHVHIRGLVKNGATAGAVQLQMARSAAGGTGTVYAGSTLRAQKMGT